MNVYSKRSCVYIFSVLLIQKGYHWPTPDVVVDNDRNNSSYIAEYNFL